MYIQSQWTRKTLAEWEMANTSFAQEQKRLIKSILKDNLKPTHVKINLINSIKEQLQIKLARIQSEKPYIRQKYCQNAIRFEKLGKASMIICPKGLIAMNDKHSKLLSEYVILMDKKKKILDRKKLELKHRNSLIASTSPYMHNLTQNFSIPGAKMTSSITICPISQVAPQMKKSKNMNKSFHVSKKSELNKSIVLYQSQVCQEYETLIPKARKIWSNQQQMIDWMKFSMSSQTEFNLWLSIVGISKYERKFSKIVSMHRQNQDSTLNYSMSRSEDFITLEMSRDQSRRAQNLKKLSNINRPLFNNLIQEKGAQISLQYESIRIIDFIDLNSETLLNVSKSLTNKSFENNQESEQNFGQERMAFEENLNIKVEKKDEQHSQQSRIPSKEQENDSIGRIKNIEIQMKQEKTQMFLPQPKSTEEEQLLIQTNPCQFANLGRGDYVTSQSIQIQNLPNSSFSRSQFVDQSAQILPQSKPSMKKMSSFMCEEVIIQEEEEELCQKSQQMLIEQEDKLDQWEKNIMENNKESQEVQMPKIEVKQNKSKAKDKVELVQTQIKPQVMACSSVNSTKSSKQKLNKILQNLSNVERHAPNPASNRKNVFQPIQKECDNNNQSSEIKHFQLKKIGPQDNLLKMNFTTESREKDNQEVTNQLNYQNKQNISAKMNQKEQKMNKLENPSSIKKINPFSSEKSNSQQSYNPFNYNPFSKNAFSPNNGHGMIQKITENKYDPFAGNKKTENQYNPFAPKTKALNQHHISNEVIIHTTKTSSNSPKNFSNNVQNKNSSNQFKKAFGRSGNQNNQISSKIDLSPQHESLHFGSLEKNQNQQNQTYQTSGSKKDFDNHPFQLSNSSSPQTQPFFKNPFVTQNQFKSGTSVNVFSSSNLFKSDQTDCASLNMFGESKKRY